MCNKIIYVQTQAITAKHILITANILFRGAQMSLTQINTS